MNGLLTPAQGRVPIGKLNPATGEVELNDEWARYFFSLNAKTNDHAATLTESAQHAALYLEDGEAGETIPGQQGMQGDRGQDAPFLGFMFDAPDDMPMMMPPQQSGMWIPLDQKDASNGVAGLTLFKLNLKNALGTFVNFITNATTAARTWTMPDKDGTVAVLTDFAAPPAIGNATAADGTFVKFGSNGKAAQASVTVNAAATDLATVIALTNQLRAALIANGICS